jgi:HEPN domain-containing protein
MPHDPALVAEVRAWLSKAGKDLAAAQYELQADPPFSEDIAFHSQQAAEKSLKAFLSWHRIPFRKTHNLVELGEACCQIDQSLESLLRRAAPLTEYAWKFRYPGDPEEATAEEAGTALATAREVFVSVLSRLPSDVGT